VLNPTNLAQTTFINQLEQLAPDCCPVVAYGGLIPQRLLAIPDQGWINLHFSVLPAWRGAAPVQRALLAGSTLSGLTTFRLVEDLDAGPFFLRQTVAISQTETAGDLLARLALLGAVALDETMTMLELGEKPHTQPTNGVSFAPKIHPGEARIDLNQTAEQVIRQVRAMSPDPGAWALLGSQRFKVLRAGLVLSDPKPGIEPADVGNGCLWATKTKLFCRVADTWIELVEVQAAGKKPLAGADWARGAWQTGVCLV
jgi:methionyl-tRNA formyltransferase